MSGIIITVVWLILNIKDLIETVPFFLWLFFNLILIISIRAFVYTTVREFRKRGINQKKIIVFGVGNLGKSLIEQIRKSPESGYQILSLFDNDKSLWDGEINSVKILGGTEELRVNLEMKKFAKFGSPHSSSKQ